MALTNDQAREVWREFYRLGFGKEEIQVHTSLPSKSQIKTMLDNLDDDVVARFTSTWKPNIDTDLGITTTNVEAQKIVAAYMTWKRKNLLGI